MTTARVLHPCAACQRPARAGHLMCGGCWHGVPKPLQLDVYRTWRAFERRKNPRIGLASLAEYRKACDAALTALKPTSSEQR